MIPQQLLFFFAAPPAACEKQFLGLITWYRYLPDSDWTAGSCDIHNFTFLPSGGTPSDVPLIMLALVDDLLRIAGMVAVAFIIYGAIQYIGSQGNPEQTARAQSTILNALIGLAIAIVAVTFVAFLGNKLGG